MQFIRTVLLMGCGVFVVVTPTVAQPTRYRVVVPGQRSGDPMDLATLNFWLTWLADHDLDEAGFLINASTVDVIVRDPAGSKVLTDAGFTILETQTSAPLPAATVQRGVPTGFVDPAGVEAFLDATSSGHPTITRKFSIGQSVQGRDIWAMEISNNPGVVEDKPSIQFNALHHAREVATPHVVMDVITFLTDEYAAGDPQVVNWVDNYKIFCVPMVNPDGSNRVFTVDNFHRKNLGTSCTGSNPGVDLNRNYPYHWGFGTANCERGSGSSGSCPSDAYRGPQKASEPETQAMMTLAGQERFVIAVSYHSFGRFIDYPYACNDGNPDMSMPEHAMIDELMQQTAAGIFAVDGVSYSVFSPIAAGPVNGDDTSWYYAHNGTYALIIEIGTDFQPAFSTALASVNRSRGGWQYLLTRLGQARIDFRVADHLTGQPLVAEVDMLDFVFDTDELPRFTEPAFGRSRWLVPANNAYTAQVSAAGYATRTVPVSVANAPVDTTVLLLANGETLGDVDQDGDTDLVEYARMQQCAGVSPIPLNCRRIDMDGDELITLSDYALLEPLLGGPQ